MQVIVKSRHTRVPAALKAMAVEKIERVRRFFDRITKLEIEFSEEHNPRVSRRHIVEVTLSTKNHVVRAVGTGVDPASAVDAVVDKLETQVKRIKDKIVKRGRSTPQPETIRIPSARGRPARKRGAAANGAVESGPRVRRMGRFSVEPMTPREAVEEMDTAGEVFLPFVNADTKLVSVVYRMADGTYGLMEPEGDG
ncbi:MAG: ribosome hibernation-promoting factor, HPF/YfiA family [Actinomycetota bacterium]